jgi:hypothetical protein
VAEGEGVIEGVPLVVRVSEAVPLVLRVTEGVPLGVRVSEGVPLGVSVPVLVAVGEVEGVRDVVDEVDGVVVPDWEAPGDKLAVREGVDDGVDDGVGDGEGVADTKTTPCTYTEVPTAVPALVTLSHIKVVKVATAVPQCTLFSERSPKLTPVLAGVGG